MDNFLIFNRIFSFYCEIEPENQNLHYVFFFHCSSFRFQLCFPARSLSLWQLKLKKNLSAFIFFIKNHFHFFVPHFLSQEPRLLNPFQKFITGKNSQSRTSCSFSLFPYPSQHYNITFECFLDTTETIFLSASLPKQFISSSSFINPRLQWRCVQTPLDLIKLLTLDSFCAVIAETTSCPRKTALTM